MTAPTPRIDGFHTHDGSHASHGRLSRLASTALTPITALTVLPIPLLRSLCSLTRRASQVHASYASGQIGLGKAWPVRVPPCASPSCCAPRCSLAQSVADALGVQLTRPQAPAAPEVFL
jgi:hypothetical protein